MKILVFLLLLRRGEHFHYSLWDCCFLQSLLILQFRFNKQKMQNVHVHQVKEMCDIFESFVNIFTNLNTNNGKILISVFFFSSSSSAHNVCHWHIEYNCIQIIKIFMKIIQWPFNHSNKSEKRATELRKEQKNREKKLSSPAMEDYMERMLSVFFVERLDCVCK